MSVSEGARSSSRIRRSRRGGAPADGVRALVETSRATGEGGQGGGEAGWLELKGDAFRAESYAEIDAMAGEAARRFGKRPRVFVLRITTIAANGGKSCVEA